jgi:hypothetical protein
MKKDCAAGKRLKIRLDECIANRIARATIEITANRPGYEVSYIQHGDDSVDPDWITKFFDEDGTAIVSGDHDILQHWPNLIAYTESGLISFFPPKCYVQQKAYGRAAFFTRWCARRLMDDTRLPLDWNERRRSLGFASTV